MEKSDIKYIAQVYLFPSSPPFDGFEKRWCEEHGSEKMSHARVISSLELEGSPFVFLEKKDYGLNSPEPEIGCVIKTYIDDLKERIFAQEVDSEIRLAVSEKCDSGLVEKLKNDLDVKGEIKRFRLNPHTYEIEE